MLPDGAVAAHFADIGNVAPLGDPAGQKAVYACTLADGRLAVLKVVKLPQMIDEDTAADYNEAVGRLRREIGILGSIDSPYVAKLAFPGRDLELTDIEGVECAYYFEERVCGASVEEMITGGVRLDCPTVARMGAHIASAIEQFWLQEKVHRDVKPANIMHDVAGDVFVLLDAGYALDLNAPSYTRLLGIVGTLPYFSPEQLDLANKRKLDFRCDLYALGVVMYVALAGCHPYITPGMTQDQQFDAIANTRPAAVQIEPGSEPVWDVILRLLEKQPHARYRSCDMVADALAGVY